MLEWNMFVKPVIYVIELIFGAVVTLGTADKLLIQCPGPDGGVRESSWRLCCALDLRRNPLASCITVILVGAGALLLLLYVLWRRLVAAFDNDELFVHGTEAQLCACAAILWLVVASVLTSASRMEGDTRGEQIVSVVFAWLLVCFCFGSAAVAWLVPEEDAVPTRYDFRSDANESQVVPPVVVEPPPTSAPPTPIPQHGEESTTVPTRDATTTTSMPENMSLALSSEGSELKRSDAARMNSDQPDTEFINRKLTDWEQLIDGPPPPDAHSNALASARRMPVAVVDASTAFSQGGSSSLRRRLAVVQQSEDEITPDVAKMRQTHNAKTD